MLQELSTEGQHFLREIIGFFRHFILTGEKHLQGLQSAVLYHTRCFSVLLLQVSYNSSPSWAANLAQYISPLLPTTLLQQDQKAPSHSANTEGQHAILQCSFSQRGRRGSSGKNAQPASSQQAGKKLQVLPLSSLRDFPNTLRGSEETGNFLPSLDQRLPPSSHSPTQHRTPPFCELSLLLHPQYGAGGAGPRGSRNTRAQQPRPSAAVAPWECPAAPGPGRAAQEEGRERPALRGSTWFPLLTLSPDQNRTTGSYVLPKTPNTQRSLTAPLSEERKKKRQLATPPHTLGFL